MLCLLQSTCTSTTILVGNAHFEPSPMKDHVKFAQAIHYIERAAKYIKASVASSSRDSMPFISGGDFNSQPVSSAMSVFYNENIIEKDSDEVSPSTWRIPDDFERER